MNRRLLVIALFLAAALIGCGPPWHVIVQAAPDPFLGQTRFAVAPIDYTGLHIGEKPEAVYLSEKDPKQQASFAEDKAALNDNFARALMANAGAMGIDVALATGPGSAPWVVHPYVNSIEPGFYVGVAAKPSHVDMVVRITAPDGRVLDEIVLGHGTQSGMTNPSSGQRLRSDGDALGVIVSRYLKSRVAPEPR